MKSYSFNKLKRDVPMFAQLKKIDDVPRPFDIYTAETLWNDPHISKQMLSFHLNPDAEPASRPHAFIRDSADWIVHRFGVGPGSRIADFGCGPGLYTSRFARTGARVTGIDFSERSIQYAREDARARNLSIKYIRQNYLSFQSEERFDLICLIYCDFCALSPAQRRDLLLIFRRILGTGGRLFLDVSTLAAFDKRLETVTFGHRLMDGFWSARDYYGFMKTVRYESVNVVLDKYVIVEPDRQWEVYNWLQYFSRETLAREFADAGFRITDTYADVSGAAWDTGSDTMAVVAEKLDP